MRASVSLRRLLSLQFILAAGVPFVVTLVILIAWMRPQLSRDAEETQRQLALSFADQVESRLNNAAANLATLASAVQGTVPLDRVRVEALLDRYLAPDAPFDAVYLVDPAGRPVALGLNELSRRHREQLRAVDVSRQNLFAEVRAGNGPAWSDSFLSIVTRKVTVAHGVPVGPYTMIGELSATRLDAAITATTRTGGLLFLLDRDKRVIADNAGTLTGQQLSLSNVPLVRSDAAAGDVRSGRFEYQHADYMGSIIPVKPVGWSVLVGDRVETVYAPLALFIRILAASAVMAAVLGLALAFGLARTLASVIDTTTQHAERVAAGSYDARAPGTRVNEIRSINLAIDNISRKVMDREALLRDANATLEERVRQRTRDLERANAELAEINRELETFAYTVSHDLRTPLRGINGFATILAEDFAPELPKDAQDNLGRIRAAAVRMEGMIDDILRLSSVSRAEMLSAAVDLSAMSRRIALHLGDTRAGRPVDWRIGEGMRASADPGMVNLVLENLLGNAHKYSSKIDAPVIEVAQTSGGGAFVEFCVRDNGAGFDPAHAGLLFKPFKRLHGRHEFEGNGIGLATVHRILQRHGGEIRAEAFPGQGATFYFTLPTLRSDP